MPKVGEVLEPDIEKNKFYCDTSFVLISLFPPPTILSVICVGGGDTGLLKR